MATESQTLWLHAGETLTIEELSTATGLTVTQIDELVEYGALSPVGDAISAPRASAACGARHGCARTSSSTCRYLRW